MTIVELRKLLGAQGKPEPVTTWEEVERVFDLEFPADYKEWCAEYPSLVIDEYLTVHNLLESPAARERDLAIETSDMLRECTSAVNGGFQRPTNEQAITEDAERLTFFPQPGGVLVVGVSDNNELLCWRTAPTPDAWTIVATDNKYWDWWDSGAGFTAALAGILSGRMVCPVFAGDFPDRSSVQRYRDTDDEVGYTLGPRRPWGTGS